MAVNPNRWANARILEAAAKLTEEQYFDYTSTEDGRHQRLLWETMAHMVNHGTQPRSEAAAMLAEMGHSPPATSI
jgi:uncharacterized damage-inducible protein DinB